MFICYGPGINPSGPDLKKNIRSFEFLNDYDDDDHDHYYHRNYCFVIITCW